MPNFRSIAEDNLTDIAQFNPHLRLFLDDEQKDFVEQQLGDTRMMLYEWEGDITTHRAVDIIKQALVEEEDWIVYRIMDILGFDNRMLNMIVIQHAALNGRDDVIDYMAENGAESWEALVDAASKVGDLALLKEIDEKETVNWLLVVSNAAHKGHVDMLNYALANCGRQVDDSLLMNVAIFAAYGGQRDIVYDMIDRCTPGNVQYPVIAFYAAKGNHLDLMEEMIKGGESFVELASAVAQHGSRNSVFDFLRRAEQNGEDVDERAISYIALNSAAYGRQDIVDDMLAGVVKTDGTVVRANDYNSIAANAAKVGNSELVDRMIRLGADKWSMIAREAASGGYKRIVEALLVRGGDVSNLNFGEHEDAKIYFNSRNH